MEPQASSARGLPIFLKWGRYHIGEHYSEENWHIKEPHMAPDTLKITFLVDPSSYWCLWFLTFGVCILKEGIDGVENVCTISFIVQNEKFISCGQSLVHL